MTVGKTLDRLRPQHLLALLSLHRVWRVAGEVGTRRAVLAVHLRVGVDISSLIVLAEHHQPAVLLFPVLPLVDACFVFSDVCVLYRAQILTAVGFDDDDVAFADLQTGVFEEVEDVDARAFEAHHVEQSARAVRLGVVVRSHRRHVVIVVLSHVVLNLSLSCRPFKVSDLDMRRAVILWNRERKGRVVRMAELRARQRVDTLECVA